MLLAQQALAQPTPSDKATARILGTEGLRLAEAGDCEGAIEKLRRAEELFHAPTTLGRLGECQVKLGLLVAGTENLQRVVREPLPEGASPAFKAAKDRARLVLDEALPKIGMLRIEVTTSLSDVSFTVTVDGQQVPPAILGARRPTDPGERVVEATGPYCEKEQERVKLEEGGEVTVRLALRCEKPPEPPRPSEPPVGSKPGSTPGVPSPRRPPDPDQTLAYVALGVGGAGVVAGSVFGLMAMGEKSALEGDCNDERKCPSTSQSNLDNLDRYALVSNVAFGVGIVGVGVGAAMLLMADSPGPTLDAGPSKQASMRPWIGMGSAGLAGTF